jgi:hypothetical protein
VIHGDNPTVSSLRPETLTWTALLAKWMDFAKASLALPEDDEGDRWRASVPSVINLQAVTFALADLAQVEPADRPHARDKAEVLIRQSARALQEAWRGVPMPASLLEMADDARTALEMSVYAGAQELIWIGPGELVMPAARIEGNEGTLAVMQPGTIVMPGEPVAWWCERDGAPLKEGLSDCALAEPDVPRQVFRQIDDGGRIVRDVIAPLNVDPSDLPPGLPLIVPIYEQGRTVGHFTMVADEWLARQRDAMPESGVSVEVLASRGPVS